MCNTCNSNIALKIVAAKQQVQELFSEYGILSPATVQNVDAALQEEDEMFEVRLMSILDKVSIRNNTGDTAGTTDPNKQANAMAWTSLALDGISGLTGTIMNGKNPAPVNNYYAVDPNASVNTNTGGGMPQTTMYIIIAIVVALLIAMVAYFALAKK